MPGQTVSSHMRPSGLSLRVAAAAITMLLLIAGSTLSRLAGTHAGAGTEHGSHSHATADADHVSHADLDVTAASDAPGGDGTARAGAGTAEYLVDRSEYLRDGAKGCTHNVHDPRDATLARAAASDLLTLPAGTGGFIRDSYVQGRSPVSYGAVRVSLSIVQLSISRT